MFKNNSWESLVWVIIWVFILTFILLWITNLMINSVEVINTYKNKRDISLIRNNTINTIKKLDTTSVQESEVFYLYKNTTNNNFEILTWSWNYLYKYIDRLWNKVDNLETFPWNIYSRVLRLEREDTSLWKEQQIIKVSVKKLIKK